MGRIDDLRERFANSNLFLKPRDRMAGASDRMDDRLRRKEQEKQEKKERKEREKQDEQDGGDSSDEE